MTQRGLPRQGRAGAERGSRDPATRSPRRPPTPSLRQAGPGRRVLPRGAAAQEGAHQGQSRRLAIQSLPEARGEPGPLVPNCWAPPGTRARASVRSLCRPQPRTHRRAHGARHPLPGPRRPPPRRAASPASAPRPRIPTRPRDHPRSPRGNPRGSPRATPPIRVRARTGGASRAPGRGAVMAKKETRSYRGLQFSGTQPTAELPRPPGSPPARPHHVALSLRPGIKGPGAAW